MKARAVAVSVIVGTLAIFAWQVIASALLPWSAAMTGPLLVKQAAIDFVVVAALCFFVGLVFDRSPLGIAKAAAVAGFAMIFLQENILSTGAFDEPTLRSAVAIVDRTVSFFFTGFVVGWLMHRFGGNDPVELPEGQGYRVSGKRRATVAR